LNKTGPKQNFESTHFFTSPSFIKTGDESFPSLLTAQRTDRTDFSTGETIFTAGTGGIEITAEKRDYSIHAALGETQLVTFFNGAADMNTTSA
jgi:hypothetical protein